MKGGFIIYSDQYRCSTIFCWRKGCLEILGISYLNDGLSIDDIIRDIAEYSGVAEREIKRLLRKLRRRQGYYQTSLKDLRLFIEEIENRRERREIEIMSRAAVLSSII